VKEHEVKIEHSLSNIEEERRGKAEIEKAES
jgi:hypothetical protein